MLDKKKQVAKEKDAPAETAGWLRCRNGTPLTNKESKALSAACNNVDWPAGSSASLYYAFTERALKEYKTLQKSEIHLNKRNVFKSAISQVMEQVRPASDKPFLGEASTAADALMPVLTQVVV